jgi:dipeptidyl aminopeptidase/acylaminoacyl peptidase
MKLQYLSSCMLFFCVHICFCIHVCYAGSFPPGFSRDTLAIEKALSRYNIGTPLISPDGKKAIVAVTQTGAGPDLPATHLWLLDIPTKKLFEFTNSAKSESSPKWSPDGQQLAFLSARNGLTQIYLIGMSGGEALPLTKSKTAIWAFEWSPNGKNIVYATQDELTDSIKKRQADKFDEIVVSESQQPSRLFLVDVNTKKTRLLMKQNWGIGDINWYPSGNELLLVVRPLPSGEIPLLKLVKFSLVDSTLTNLPTPDHSFWGNFLISPDGRTAVFNSARTDGPIPHDLFIYELTENKYRNLSAKTLDRTVIRSKFTDNHTLLSLVQNGVDNRLYVIRDNGDISPYVLKDNIQSFDVCADGSLVYVKGSFDQMPELYLTQPGGQPERVSNFNQSFDSVGLVAPKVFSYKSFDGKTIEGVLYKPAGIADGKPAAGVGGGDGKVLPLVVFIHGGPTGSFSNSYSAWAQLLVQKGYAVFCPNIRGSTGYGWDFLVSNRKDWGGNDYKDMMSGIDYLIKNEQIDPNRLGISGWSYGGFMAEWAITQTHRFKASVSGAGIANLASEFGTENGPAYDHWFWGNPYENGDLYYQHSPIAFVKNATTPTLIIQGEEDETDPKGQSQELYRGLRFYHVPCELVLYPREPHGFRELNHNIDFYRRMLMWFERYL